MDHYFKAVLAIAIFLPLLFSLGIFHGYLTAPPGTVFVGLDSGQDQLVYASFIKEASGTLNVLQSNRFTTDFGIQTPVILNLLFWFLGLVMRLTGLSAALVLIGFRIIVEFLFFVLAWFFLGHFFQDTKKRFVAFLLIAIGGGIGWLTNFAGLFIQPIGRLMATDISYYLGFSTFGHLYNALFFAGMLLFILILEQEIAFYKDHRNYRLALIAALVFLAYAIHPVSFLFIATALVFEHVFRFLSTLDWKETKRLLPVFFAALVGILVVGLLIWWSFSNPSFRYFFERYSSYFQRTTSIFWYPFGYGLLLLLALYGLFNNDLKEPKRSIIFSWLLSAFILAVNPWKGLRFQPHLHIPLVIFAVFGFFYLEPRIRKWLSGFKIRVSTNQLIAAAVILLSLSAPLIAFRHFEQTRVQDVKSPFLEKGLLDTFQYLDAKPRGTLAAVKEECMVAPAFTPHFCFLGNWSLTPDGEKKKATMEQLFFGSLQEKEKILRENSFDYLLSNAENDFSSLGYRIGYRNEQFAVWEKAP